MNTKNCAKSRNLSRKRLNTQLWAAVSLTAVGSALLVTGFIVPPMGEIHPSVLIAFGQVLTFVGAVFGIDYHYKDKLFNSKS